MRPFAPSAVGSGRSLDPLADSEPSAVGLPSLVAESASALVPAAIRAVVEQGHRVEGERPTRELLNQQLCQLDPRRRIFAADGSSFNVAVAVARFVWHLGGNSQLSAIAFYEPRAHLFSDDGQILPGSNSGARLFGDRTGVDQIRGIVSRIRTDASSRRGAAVVWRPEDAVRQSRDIPCTMAMACHLRAGQLLTTVSMRSNNAVRLLPYNLFEYTMLAELIAAELDVELGPYWHSVNSLHVFDEELEAAAAISSSSQEPHDSAPQMPEMPRGNGVFEQAAALVESEELLRVAVIGKDWRALAEVVEEAEARLRPYWFGIFCVLTLFSAARGRATDQLDASELLRRIPPALRAPLIEILE